MHQVQLWEASNRDYTSKYYSSTTDMPNKIEARRKKERSGKIRLDLRRQSFHSYLILSYPYYASRNFEIPLTVSSRCPHVDLTSF